MNKKGLSTVVATVLIILVTIIAITLIWQVLRQTIKKSTGQISTGCVDVDLDVLSCNAEAGGAGSTVVRLNKGAISKLKIYSYDGSGNEVGDPVEEASLPEELETKTYNNAPLDGASKANVAVWVSSESGEDILCGFMLAEPKTCT